MTLDLVIADDAVLFRDMLAGLLVDRLGATVRVVGDPIDLAATIAERAPDLAVIDIRLPPTFTVEGLDAAVALRTTHPGLAVLVLSQHLESHHLDRLLRPGSGGFGYLLKDRVPGLSSFVDAVRRVAAGATVVDAEIVATNLERTAARTALARLSPREQQVLGLIAEGRSNQSICTALGLSAKTLETHIRSIFQRLDLPVEADAHRRVLAALAYLRALR